MRSFRSSADVLRALDDDIDSSLLERLDNASIELREVLARSIAGLHPDRPYNTSEIQYRPTRRLLDRFQAIYTVSYDLLLCWSLACGGSMAIYGHSLDDNDDHILRAITKSKITKLAISIHGAEDSESNSAIIRTGERTGEALAAHWPDFDEHEKILKMSGNVIRAKGRGQIMNRGKTEKRGPRHPLG